MQATLVPHCDGRPIRLKKDVTVVGRRRHICDIYLDDPTISTFHCLLIKTPHGLRIRDLHSRNGTFVNGRSVTQAPVSHGDDVMFATRRYRLHIDDMLPVSRSSLLHPPDRSRAPEPVGQAAIEGRLSAGEADFLQECDDAGELVPMYQDEHEFPPIQIKPLHIPDFIRR